MQILCDSTSIQEAACSTTDPELKVLIQAHLDRLSEYPHSDLGALVNIVIVERGSTVLELEGALGFSVRVNRFSGCHYGDAEYLPSWEIIEEHKFWYGVVMCSVMTGLLSSFLCLKTLMPNWLRCSSTTPAANPATVPRCSHDTRLTTILAHYG